jgi:hypothetical protein
MEGSDPLHVQRVGCESLLPYPISGGFQKWSLIPNAMVGSMPALKEECHNLFQNIRCLE